MNDECSDEIVKFAAIATIAEKHWNSWR